MSTTSVRDRRPTPTTGSQHPVEIPAGRPPTGRGPRAALALGLAALALVGSGLALRGATGSPADVPAPPAPVQPARWGGPDVYEPGGRTAPQADTGRWGGPDVFEPGGRTAPRADTGRWGGPDVYEPRSSARD